MSDNFGTALPRLSEAERDALLPFAARAAWPAGFIVYQRGSPADGVFLVTAGHVVLRSRVRAARGFVPWIAARGETFGSEGLGVNARYATDARADVESETLFISGANLRALIREAPQAAVVLLGQLMAERAALLERLRELTTLSVEHRLVTTVLRLSSMDTFVRDDGRVELGAQRYRLLCELVGATRESVSLVLNRLTAEGLVERRGTTLFVKAGAELAQRIDANNAFPLVDADLALHSSTVPLEQHVQ